MSLPARCDVTIVGAGLAGLACAARLAAADLDVHVVESADAVGGRVRTDRVDGFLLDRGFQVLNTAYPEARARLDLAALNLRRFTRGVILHAGGQVVRVADPRRDPGALRAIARAPVGSARETLALAGYAAGAAYLPAWLLRRRTDREAYRQWRRYGLSERVIDRVLRPFYTGLLLETDMATSARFTDVMMRMFVRGDSAVPAAGMSALPAQLAARLPAGSLHLHTAAASVRASTVDTGDGRVRASTVGTGDGRVRARATVVATDAEAADTLLADGLPADGLPADGPARGITRKAWHGVSTVYHAVPVGETADLAAAGDPTLIVDAEPSPITNSVVLTAAAPSYSTDGRALVATSLAHHAGHRGDLDPAHEPTLLNHLARLYRTDTRRWERIATYDIAHALPSMTAPHPLARPVRVEAGGGLYVCGDHRDTSSIQGALVSGRRAAEAVLTDLGHPASRRARSR